MLKYKHGLQRLDLKSSNKCVNLQILSIYDKCKNMRKQYKNIKLKITPTWWNDKIELPDGFYSVSDIQEYIECIIKKHETLTTIPPVYVYINRISNRSVF